MVFVKVRDSYYLLNSFIFAFFAILFMQQDILSDILTRIRNGYNAKLLSIIVLNSKFSLLILNLLLRLGFISSFVVINKQHILVFLMYYRNQSAVRYVNRISKINNRIFIKKKWLLNHTSKSSRSSGFYVISTVFGLLTDLEALSFGVGGEILFEIG